MKNNKVALTITLQLFLLIFCFQVLEAFAQKQISEQIFYTPKTLRAATIDGYDDTLAVLNSPVFYDDLKQLANQILSDRIAQERMFNKTALLSIREQHHELLREINQFPQAISYTHYTLDSQTALAIKQSDPRHFEQTLRQSLNLQLATMDNETLLQFGGALGWSVSGAVDYVTNIFMSVRALETLSEEQAINLIVNSHLYHVLARVIPISQTLIKIEQDKRYDITPETLITTPDGIELAATIVKPKGLKGKSPTAMQFTIYADEAAHIRTAIHAAAHGYIGVVVNTRGKRSSSSAVVPWEHEGKDATNAIDWISKQPWSNGEVVMYGGSYNGFTQWAAAKHMHPALKAIAPYTAASLITGLPYENNIVLTGNYQWAAYATNNNTVDASVYNDWQKSSKLVEDMYTSGRAISDIDKIDGVASPWFQKWLSHPAFDDYYQAMVPVKEEYKNINIPVLTVTGYFDGGQISAIDYLTRHYKYNKNADHTLLIGPYDHRSAQEKAISHFSNYQLDEVALKKDTEEIVFAWFDHLLLGKEQPELLKDKVNYQLMGSNLWRHANSYAAMNAQARTYFLSTSANDDSQFFLLTDPEDKTAFISQTIDMTDRTTEHNRAPWPVIQEQLNEPNGLIFMTEAFDSPQELAGAITGHFSIAVNKKDVDIGYNFYEIDQEGRAFHLNTYRSRASFANDMSQRQLLTPNIKTMIPIVNARMAAKLIAKGSRLAIVLNVNKNRDAQVNLGSGKPVNNETVADAGQELSIKWFNDSRINIPLKPWQGS